MRIVRYTTRNVPPSYGWVLGDAVGPLQGDPFGEFHRLETEYPLEKVHLLAPVLPSKIVCIGRNYVAHAKEHDAEVPDLPLIFLKPPTTIIGPGDRVVLPPQSQQVEHEGELVVVIGKQARWVPPEQALEYVLGYTIGNDVTARDLQMPRWAVDSAAKASTPSPRWVHGSRQSSTRRMPWSPALSMARCARWLPRGIWSSVYAS